MGLTGELNENVTLFLKLWDGNTSQYPQAKIYDRNGSLQTTLDLTHISSGIYKNSWSTSIEGYYSADIIVYSDSNHTTKNSNYNEVEETIWITEAYGGGGGGIGKLNLPNYVGKKSAWSYKEKMEVLNSTKQIIETTKLILSFLKTFKKDLEKLNKKSSNELKSIKTLITSSKNQLTKAEESIRTIKKDDSVKLITDNINGLQENLNKIESNIGTKDDITSLLSKLDSITNELNDIEDVMVETLSESYIDRKEEEIYESKGKITEGNTKS